MHIDEALSLLRRFTIETPSWGYADTGTRFGKFFQDAAAATTDEKFADAGTVHRYTGMAPKVAVHALWDFGTPSAGSSPEAQVRSAQESASRHGVQIGAINPNLFEDQVYKFGSICSSDPAAQAMAEAHVRDCLRYAEVTGSRDISLWFADGTNYPGQDDIRARKNRLESALRRWHDSMGSGQRLLIEYKPFEPAFYHTDIADWGMAYAFAQKAGNRAKVLVDTGHHLPGANIEHIVAFLVDEGRLGGFHFNDRKYADDDLTLASIDPYALFRIFHELVQAVVERKLVLEDVSFCIDQSHNLKPKIEAMIQSVTVAQELFLKACLVDHRALADCQANRDIVGGERCLTQAFTTDVRPILARYRGEQGLAPDPLEAYRHSGHQAGLEAERGSRNRAKRVGSSYA